MRQQLAILLLACLAFELSQAWLLKLPKLEDLVEKLEDKKDKDLKKLDFLNLFAAKDEKKLNEWEKVKEWFEDKKLKELDFFESKKEKSTKKKPGKKNKSKTRTTVDCYDEVETTTATSYEHDKYYSEEKEEEEEEVEEEVVVSKPQPCDCKANNDDNYHSRVATAYDVREDYEEGVRYFT